MDKRISPAPHGSANHVPAQHGSNSDVPVPAPAQRKEGKKSNCFGFFLFYLSCSACA